jgi:hypothetical protein
VRCPDVGSCLGGPALHYDPFPGRLSFLFDDGRTVEMTTDGERGRGITSSLSWVAVITLSHPLVGLLGERGGRLGSLIISLVYGSCLPQSLVSHL